MNLDLTLLATNSCEHITCCAECPYKYIKNQGFFRIRDCIMAVRHLMKKQLFENREVTLDDLDLNLPVHRQKITEVRIKKNSNHLVDRAIYYDYPQK